MITFHAIQWKNFLSTGNSWTKVVLDGSPTTLVVGENGSGKSTVLDALTFALFGKPFRKINKPQLVNSINGGDCLVEVSFSIGTKHYLVRRGIKPGLFEILIDGQKLNQLANARDFQELLESQILKLNYKSFTQVVILGSSTFVPFMQLSAANRREVIEDLLDIQIFSSMNTILKQRMSLLKDGLKDAESAIALKDQFISVQTENLERIEKGNENLIKDHKSDIEKLHKDNTSRETKIEDHIQEVSDLENQTSDFKKNGKKLKEAEKIDSKLQSKETALNREVKFYEDNDECPTCEQHIDVQFKEGKNHTLTEKLSEVHTARTDIANILSGLNETLERDSRIFANIQEINTEISSLNTKISATNEIIRTLENNIKNLSEKGDISKVQSDITKAKEELSELNSEKEILLNDSELQKIASSLLKDSGIKTRIIKQYIPIMNTLINKYLASMDFFVNFTLDENFDETIKSRHRDDFSYASFSEGEKMRIDLALLFTWRTVAKLKNSTNTNLLILDEVFDSSLDDSGTQEFLKILYTLGTDQNVFVISHKGDVLQDKFNNILKFGKIKGFSRIVS
tara:strand:+ start:2972 stop:4684 length:1713 start_codon:yes stop_codon:yes gene_type:complete